TGLCDLQREAKLIPLAVNGRFDTLARGCANIKSSQGVVGPATLKRLSVLGDHLPCYNSVRKTAKGKCSAVFRLRCGFNWQLGAGYWQPLHAPWISINSKPFSK
ncbi:MAG: hypothetical protein WAK89_00150, partial [Candidatus Sulfotelmatobacter sp.]